jgi:hypothetical protein
LALAKEEGECVRLVSLSFLGTVSYYSSIEFETGTGTTHEQARKLRDPPRLESLRYPRKNVHVLS